MILLHFIFFSLGLSTILRATATNIDHTRKPYKRRPISSDDENDSGPQQKMTRKLNILPGKYSESQYSSSDAKNDHTKKSKRQMLRKDIRRTSKLPAKVNFNLNKRKLEKKTKSQKRIKSAIFSDENTPKERDLNGFLELVSLTPPIQDAFLKHITNIYSFDRKTKSLILNGDSSCEGFSWQVYILRVCYSTLYAKALIFKNLAIGRIIFKTITFFLTCYKDTLEMLIFDHCFFSPNFAIQDDLKLTNLHTAKITYCALNPEILKNILAVLPSSLQSLELSYLCFNSSVDNYKHFGEYLTLDFSFLNVNRFTKLKNLAVRENDIATFRFENFKNLEEFECDKLFLSYDLLKYFYTLIESITAEDSNLSTLKLTSSPDLLTLESNLSHYLSEWNYLIEDLPCLLNAFYISAELVTTESYDLLSQISKSMKLIKEKCSKVYELQRKVNDHSDNLKEVKSKLSELLNEVSKLQSLSSKKCPKLSDKLKQLRNLKRINTGEYDFRDHLNYFVEKNIVVASDSSVAILHADLSNIPTLLSTFTNIWFSLEYYTADDINLIPLENEGNFIHLNKLHNF